MASTSVLTNAVADLLNKSIPQLQYEISQTKKSIRNNEQKICQIQELIKDMGNNGNTNDNSNGNYNENASCSCKDLSKMNTCEVMLQTTNNNTFKHERSLVEMTFEEFNEIKSTFSRDNPEKIDFTGCPMCINLRDFNTFDRELIKEVASFRMIEARCFVMKFTPTFLYNFYYKQPSRFGNFITIDREYYPYITDLVFDYGYGGYIYNDVGINIKSRDDGVQYFKYINNIVINGNVSTLTLNISNRESNPHPDVSNINEYLDQEPNEMKSISFPAVRDILNIDIKVPIAIDFLDISKTNKINRVSVLMLILTKPTIIKMSVIHENDHFNVFYTEGNKPKLISDELTSEELAEYDAKMQVVTLISNQ